MLLSLSIYHEFSFMKLVPFTYPQLLGRHQHIQSLHCIIVIHSAIVPKTAPNTQPAIQLQLQFNIIKSISIIILPINYRGMEQTTQPSSHSEIQQHLQIITSCNLKPALVNPVLYFSDEDFVDLNYKVQGTSDTSVLK